MQCTGYSDFYNQNWQELINTATGENAAACAYESGQDASGQAGFSGAANGANKRVALQDDGASPGPISNRTLRKSYYDRHFQGAVRQMCEYTCGARPASFVGFASWWEPRETWPTNTAKEQGYADEVSQAGGVGGLSGGIAPA